MKKYLIFVMGIVIGIVGTSYAAYKLKAEQVSFDKTNTNLNSENVQDILDELVTDIKNKKVTNIPQFLCRASAGSTAYSDIYFSCSECETLKIGKYIRNSNGGSLTIKGDDNILLSTSNNFQTMNFDISNYSSIYIRIYTEPSISEGVKTDYLYNIEIN